MEFERIVRSQYHAALEMLKQAIERCPESLWDHPEDQTKFWQIAYHSLFYTHLYLQDTRDDFRPWAKHRDKFEALDAPREASESVEPYTRSDILEYLALCQQQIDEKTARLDLEAASGFYWLPFSKAELQFYNIRHLQQHTGELMERLGTRAHVEVDWVGMKRD